MYGVGKKVDATLHYFVTSNNGTLVSKKRLHAFTCFARK